MKTASAYKALCQEEKLFLSGIAKEVAMLVAKPPKTMDYFRKQLTVFADKWTAYETAKEAERKGKWQPSMGRPSNPLWAIWPRNAGASCFPDFGDIRPVLGAYTLLAVIHDKVLPRCPSIATEILPKELTREIWRTLVTGANLEDSTIISDTTYEPRWVIPTLIIENFLGGVKVDIENHFAPKNSPRKIHPYFQFVDENHSGQKNGTTQKPPASGEKTGQTGDNRQATSETTKQKAKSVRDLVFIGYSHKDKRWLDDLQTHLKPYVRNGSVTAWSDEQIASSSKWFPEIKAALASTKVAVLLVTPNFLASDFIHEHELGPLLKEAENGKVSILWIPVRACSYKETPLKDYQAAVDPEKPLEIMKANRNKAWVKICEEIKKIVSSSLS